MNNYQLYRTNVLLGGQLKWDIIVDKDKKSNLQISEFHISPISRNVPFTFNQDNLLLNSNHQYNVKSFYKTIKGYFYKECLDKNLDENWPILYKNDENPKLYSQIYDSGCKRAIYSIYNKQFEYFCPIWLEKLSPNDVISFTFETSLNDNKNTKYKSSLILSNNDSHYHNKFITYFNNYIEDSGIADGDNELINIDFENAFGAVNGLNAKSGFFEISNIDNITKDLISIEKPLIENDHNIIKVFENNKLISKQLFNFNLCFNIEDIVPESVAKLMYGKKIKINLTVKINDKELEKQDFYTEYENLSLYSKNNSLNYLKDYAYVNAIDMNKFNQPICHWCYSSNNNIFNLYKGLDKNISQSLLNNENIVNVENVISKNYKFNNESLLKYAFHLYKTAYINDYKYKYIPNIDYKNGIYIVGVKCKNSDIFNNIINAYRSEICELDRNVLLLRQKIYNKYLYVFIMFNNVLNINDLKQSMNTYLYDNIDNKILFNDILEFYKMISNKIEYKKIKFDKIIKIKAAESPDLNTTEITYDYDKNNINKYVIRYDGKIKPMFRKKMHNLYYKESILESNLENSTYMNNYYINFKPVYPSINYCSIKKLSENWQYNELPAENILGDTTEYSWYDINSFIILKPTIESEKVAYSKKENTKYSLDELIDIIISENYSLNINEDINLIHYIKKLYNYSIENLSDNINADYKIILNLN